MGVYFTYLHSHPIFKLVPTSQLKCLLISTFNYGALDFNYCMVLMASSTVEHLKEEIAGQKCQLVGELVDLNNGMCAPIFQVTLDATL